MLRLYFGCFKKLFLTFKKKKLNILTFYILSKKKKSNNYIKENYKQMIDLI